MLHTTSAPLSSLSQSIVNMTFPLCIRYTCINKWIVLFSVPIPVWKFSVTFHIWEGLLVTAVCAILLTTRANCLQDLFCQCISAMKLHHSCPWLKSPTVNVEMNVISREERKREKKKRECFSAQSPHQLLPRRCRRIDYLWPFFHSNCEIKMRLKPARRKRKKNNKYMWKL